MPLLDFLTLDNLDQLDLTELNDTDLTQRGMVPAYLLLLLPPGEGGLAGTGAEVVVEYVAPQMTISRTFPRTQTISRTFAQTQTISRQHAGTLEVTSE